MLPSTSSLGGAVAGTVAVADRATSSGLPGLPSDGLGLGFGSLLFDALGLAGAGSLAAGSDAVGEVSSPLPRSSQTPTEATRTSTTAPTIHGTQIAAALRG